MTSDDEQAANHEATTKGAEHGPGEYTAVIVIFLGLALAVVAWMGYLLFSSSTIKGEDWSSSVTCEPVMVSPAADEFEDEQDDEHGDWNQAICNQQRNRRLATIASLPIVACGFGMGAVYVAVVNPHRRRTTTQRGSGSNF